MRVLLVGIWFSTLQATMQARQSMQREASKRKAFFVVSDMIAPYLKPSVPLQKSG
jgi:hypothetical protein